MKGGISGKDSEARTWVRVFIDLYWIAKFSNLWTIVYLLLWLHTYIRGTKQLYSA